MPGRSGTVRPTVSPYLGLARAGNPAVNYYNQVKPQQQFYSSINRLQQQVSSNEQAIASGQELEQLPATGHSVNFLNHGGYFNNLGPRTSTNRGSQALSDLAVSRSVKLSAIRSSRGPNYPATRQDTQGP